MNESFVFARDVQPDDRAWICGRWEKVYFVDSGVYTDDLPTHTVHLYTVGDPTDPALMRPTDLIEIKRD